MLNGLDLFSGIGGMSIALSDWITTIAFCEIDTYCQAVLLSRQASKDLDPAPIWDDIKTLSGSEFYYPIDIITAGFPCQGISCAGLGKGLEDERSGLFFEIVRLAKEIKPKFLFLENVPAITSRGGLRVVREVAEMGYDCRWCVISAASIGALHRRERWFLLAHSNVHGLSACQRGRGLGECTSQGKESQEQKEGSGETERTVGIPRDVANTNSSGLKESLQSISNEKENNPPLCQGYDSNAKSKPLQQKYCTSMQKCTRRETWRGDSRECWPFESPKHWQEIVSSMDKCSDGIRSELAHIDLERCFVLLYTYAETYNESPREILSTVWKSVEAIAFQDGKTGTQADLSKEEILQQFLRLFIQEFEHNRNFEEFISSKSAKTPKEFLRSLRNEHKASSSSYRSRLQEQFSRKHPDSLSNLSFLLAQDIQSAWIEKCRQDAKDHVDQLRALGNAVVPQQAREAFQILSGLK